MGKIVITTNTTLDGVVQDPDGKEASGSAAGSTSSAARTSAPELRLETDEALGAEALLLGRRSDEWFFARWAARAGEWAGKLNRMPKYVVSSTLHEPKWANSVVLNGDAAEAVAKLKQELAGRSWSTPATSSGALIEHDLVDELRLVVFRPCSATASACSARPAAARPCA